MSVLVAAHYPHPQPFSHCDGRREPEAGRHSRRTLISPPLQRESASHVRLLRADGKTRRGRWPASSPRLFGWDCSLSYQGQSKVSRVSWTVVPRPTTVAVISTVRGHQPGLKTLKAPCLLVRVASSRVVS